MCSSSKGKGKKRREVGRAFSHYVVYDMVDVNSGRCNIYGKS